MTNPRFSDFFLEDADPQNLVNFIRKMKMEQIQQGMSFVDINIYDILPDVITNIINVGNVQPFFTRVLSADLVLTDFQSLVISGYLDTADFDIDLQGDSVIEIL